MVEITQDIVREFLDYDPETGVLTWRKRARKWFTSDGAWKSWNTKYAGGEAGSLSARGYLCVDVLGRSHKAHRLIWLWMTGEFPPAGIDHENQSGSGNRWNNLREATQDENMKNLPMFRNNTSGVTGVSWYRPRGEWVAHIRTGGKRYHLGYFTSKDAAIAARKAAEIEYGFHPNHGRIAA